MRNDSVYADAMRAVGRGSRPLRCATCWGRTQPLPDRAAFECENGHQVAMIAYEDWRGKIKRTTGLVIGPSQRTLRQLDLSELAYMAMARERRQLFEQWRANSWDPPSVNRLLDALVDEVCALHDRIAFLEARNAGRDRAAS